MHEKRWLYEIPIFNRVGLWYDRCETQPLSTKETLMFFRFCILLILMSITSCAATKVPYNGCRVYVWLSDVNTGGKCLSRAFVFEKSPLERRDNADVVADFGLGQFPVRKVLVSNSELDSVLVLIGDSIGASNYSKCSVVKIVAEDSLGNRRKGIMNLDPLLKWISMIGDKSASEFNEWFVLPQRRCCNP